MADQEQIFSDEKIISMIAQNNSLGWEWFYNKYAPIVYGTILHMTDNEPIANDIFRQVLACLKSNEMVLEPGQPICVQLLRQTSEMAARVLGPAKVQAAKSLHSTPGSILRNIVYDRHSLNDIAASNFLTVDEVKLRLRSELNQYRHRTSQQEAMSGGV